MDMSKEENLAAKRDARRRRILENAKDRLTRITGRELNADETEKIKAFQNNTELTEVYPDPEIERDVFVSQQPQLPTELFAASNMSGLGGSLDEQQQQQFLNMLNSLGGPQTFSNGRMPPNSAAFGDQSNAGGFPGFAGFPGFDGSNPLFTSMSPEATAPVPDTPLRKFLKTKLHIAFIGILSYALITAGNFKCSVFLIFLLWEIAEIFILRQHETNANPIINIVFMFLGISPTKINIFLKWVQLLNKVLRDVAIFLFAFICCHVACIWWSEATGTFAQDTMAADGSERLDHDYGL